MRSTKHEQSIQQSDAQEPLTLTDAQLDLVVGTGVGISGTGGPVQGVGISGTG